MFQFYEFHSTLMCMYTFMCVGIRVGVCVFAGVCIVVYVFELVCACVYVCVGGGWEKVIVKFKFLKSYIKPIAHCTSLFTSAGPCGTDCPELSEGTIRIQLPWRRRKKKSKAGAIFVSVLIQL